MVEYAGCEVAKLLLGMGENKSPRLSSSGELFLSLTKQNYLK
jgi:hypothetical protein